MGRGALSVVLVLHFSPSKMTGQVFKDESSYYYKVDSNLALLPNAARERKRTETGIDSGFSDLKWGR